MFSSFRAGNISSTAAFNSYGAKKIENNSKKILPGQICVPSFALGDFVFNWTQECFMPMSVQRLMKGVRPWLLYSGYSDSYTAAAVLHGAVV